MSTNARCPFQTTLIVTRPWVHQVRARATEAGLLALRRAIITASLLRPASWLQEEHTRAAWGTTICPWTLLIHGDAYSSAEQRSWRYGGKAWWPRPVAAAAWQRAAFENFLQGLQLGSEGAAEESPKDG